MSNADKRSVHTDALATLGTIIGPDEKRDAIHLAVLPMVAPYRIAVGAHVDKDGRPVAPYSEYAVGIVDPFLNRLGVDTGERFWLLIYPRVITSLRHVWAHPAFQDEAPSIESVKAVIAQDSKEWMTKWALEHMGYNYYGDSNDDRLSPEEALAAAIQAGRDNHVGPYESAANHIDSEWWDHWEAITGSRGDRSAYFSCSC